MTNNRTKRGIKIAFFLVPLLASLFSFAQYKSVKPVENLGKVEVIKPSFGDKLLVKFNDGTYAPADIKNVSPGDMVTVFLDQNKVTNTPSNHKFKVIFSLFAGILNGLMLSYLINILLPMKFTLNLRRREKTTV